MMLELNPAALSETLVLALNTHFTNQSNVLQVGPTSQPSFIPQQVI